jgi:Sulfate transporter family.
MEDQSKEISQLIEDFRYLKNAVMKTNRIFKFISSNTFRPLYLSMGLLVFIFAAAIQIFIQHYGSYANIPGAVKAIYYVVLTALLIWLAFTKMRLLIKRIKELDGDITVCQFFKEVYTWNTIITMLPYVIAMVLVAVFLANRGQSGYLVPCLAILYGLMINTATNILYLREFIVGGIWFLITGFIILFTLGPSQPLLGLSLTFGLGFIVMYIASLVFARADQE